MDKTHKTHRDNHDYFQRWDMEKKSKFRHWSIYTRLLKLSIVRGRRGLNKRHDKNLKNKLWCTSAFSKHLAFKTTQIKLGMTLINLEMPFMCMSVRTKAVSFASLICITVIWLFGTFFARHSRIQGTHTKSNPTCLNTYDIVLHPWSVIFHQWTPLVTGCNLTKNEKASLINVKSKSSKKKLFNHIFK